MAVCVGILQDCYAKDKIRKKQAVNCKDFNNSHVLINLKVDLIRKMELLKNCKMFKIWKLLEYTKFRDRDDDKRS
jgi:hypothetical protein